MQPNVVTINDMKDIETVFTTYFATNSVFMKGEDHNIQVTFNSYEDGKVLLMIEDPTIIRAWTSIFTAQGEKVISADIRLVSRVKEGLFSFRPVRVRVIGKPKREERKILSADVNGDGDSIFITDLISDFVMKDCLMRERRRLSAIEDSIIGKIQSKYSNVKVFFLNEKSFDERMKMFFGKRKPFFLDNIKKERTNKEDVEIFNFHKTLLQNDRNISQNTISEISVPFLFKSMLPFGYIQINDSRELTEEDLLYLKKTAIMVSESISRYEIITTCQDKFSVFDMSRNGLSLSFKEKSNIKHFKDGSYLYARLSIPGGKSASILCIVRNINMLKNNIFKIGCEIIEIEALGEVYYEEYLSEINDTNSHNQSGID